MRASIVAIFTNYPTGKLVHFCGHEVLTGSNNNENGYFEDYRITYNLAV